MPQFVINQIGATVITSQVRYYKLGQFVTDQGRYDKSGAIITNQGETSLYPQLPLTYLGTHLRSAEALLDKEQNIK